MHSEDILKKKHQDLRPVTLRWDAEDYWASGIDGVLHGHGDTVALSFVCVAHAGPKNIDGG